MSAGLGHAAAVHYQLSGVERAWALTPTAGPGASCGLSAAVLGVVSNPSGGQLRLLDKVGSGQIPGGQRQKPKVLSMPELRNSHDLTPARLCCLKASLDSRGRRNGLSLWLGLSEVILQRGGHTRMGRIRGP